MSDVSYAWRDPALRADAPLRLQRQRVLREAFDHARDPLISAQHRAMEQTESQRRGASERGSSMVGTDRPYPELRPKQEPGPKRAAFDRAWLREHRAARLAQYREQRQQEPRAEGQAGPTRARQR